MSHVRIAIVGSGFGGIGTAIRLKERGHHDFVILERASAVGGVWRDNSYPNAACDVPSHLYSLSFVPKHDWSHAYARQPEILAYLEECVAKYDLTPHLRFEHELELAAWDGKQQRWQLDTSRGPLTADIVVLATGALSDPALPKLPGLESFSGKTFHSATWDHSYALDGKRVAVVGTGASAIQFVPAIQPKVKHLDLYQRTPPWIVSRGDRPLGETEKRVMSAAPLRLARRAALYATREAGAMVFFSMRGARVAQWVAERHLKAQVADPVLRKKLTPDYVTGCKRILVSDEYLPALTQPNVEVITDGIARVHPDGIETTDGKRRPADAIIFGTGFKVQSMPIFERVRGRAGKTLAELWRDQPAAAHLGIAFAGFPNLFMLQGPHTGLGHTSVLLMIESQIEHVLHVLRHLGETQQRAIEPRADMQAKFVRDVDEKLKSTVWLSGGCKSWYLDEKGHSSIMWPGFTFTYKRLLEAFHASDYTTPENAE